MWLHVQYVLNRCKILNEPLLKVQKANTSTQFKRLKGSAQCMTSAQWIDEFKAAEDMMRREIAEKEERRRKRKQL